MNNLYLLLMVLGVSLASVSQILLKKGSMKNYKNIIQEYLNVWVVGGYGLLMCSMVLSIVAYAHVDYKNGPIIEALGNIFVPLLSFFFLQEKLSGRRILGITVILLGIFVFYL